MKRLLPLIALALMTLAACGPKPEEDQFVRDFFEHIRTERFDEALSHLAENLTTPDTRAQLEEIRSTYIPSSAPDQVQRINWSFVTTFGGASRATYIYRYDYPEHVLIVTTNLVIAAEGAEAKVEGFHVNVTPKTAEVAAAGEFSLTNKSPAQIGFLVALGCSVALMLMALIGTIFTKGFKRKWLWAIISLVGAPVFVMNWTTGEWVMQFLIGLINSGVSKGLAPLDPWMVKLQVPIGALIVLSLLMPHWLGKTEDRHTADT